MATRQFRWRQRQNSHKPMASHTTSAPNEASPRPIACAPGVATMLTHDPEQAARYRADTAIFPQIAVHILLDLYDTATRLIADAGAITVPTLLLGAGSDWVVKLSAQRRFFERLSSPVKSMAVLPGFYHAIFHEKDRRIVVDLVREFVFDCFSKPIMIPSLLDSNKSGYTWREYERIKNNGGAKFAIARAGLKAAGRLSRGVELGWRNGFDSGLSLDYVYENTPRGVTAIGRLIDKSYLDSIGWRGIRQRKAHLEKALRDVIQKTHGENRPIRILDIAAGAGRYVIETIRAMPEISIAATLCDNKRENVDAARVLADEFDLNGQVVTRQGNAFDRSALAAVQPRATIGIVSGLYELFPANEPVLNSLRGLADAIEPGGYLIYTNQPWHPQLEFIAHVLRNREGERWIMRRRTTAEMDELVRLAGFEKLEMEIDQWGMFTVSIARRVDRPLRGRC